MKREIADIWTKALRSGEYGQCRGNLSDGKNFCCLGVLCDIAVKNGVDVLITTEEWDNHIQYDGEAICPPNSVLEWAGFMKNNNGARYDEYTTLWELNDCLGKSFAEIADVIDKHWEYL